MAAIPWRMIVEASLPTLIEQAGKLFRKADASAQMASDSQLVEMSAEEKIRLLAERVDKLESMEAEQAKLVQQTLQTLQEVTVRAAGLQARATAAVIVSAVALIGCAIAWMR
jgi:hypothetical protein